MFACTEILIEISDPGILGPSRNIREHTLKDRPQYRKEGTKAGTNTGDSGPNSGTKVCKHQNGILNANVDLKLDHMFIIGSS